MWVKCNQVINLGGGKFLPHTKKVQVPDKLGVELIKRGVAEEAELKKMEGYVGAQQNQNSPDADGPGPDDDSDDAGDAGDE
jgi:hypothetical protein